eukprot:751810-Hanusia_phi.AAC.1
MEFLTVLGDAPGSMLSLTDGVPCAKSQFVSKNVESRLSAKNCLYSGCSEGYWLRLTLRFKVDADLKGSHDKDYIFPVGFRSSRKHASIIDPSKKSVYTSEVIKGDDGHVRFRVICEDDKTQVFEDTSANGAWGLVFDHIASMTRRSSRSSSANMFQSNRGIEQFGFSTEKIKKAIAELPGAEMCSKNRHGGHSKSSREKEREKEKRDVEERIESAGKEKKKKGAQKRGKKNEGYVQPPPMEMLRMGEFRCMEEDIEVIPASHHGMVPLSSMDEQAQRKMLHE